MPKHAFTSCGCWDCWGTWVMRFWKPVSGTITLKCAEMQCALSELHSESNVNRRAQSAESVLELLRDPSPAVRFQAMLSISSGYENGKIESITSFMHEHADHSTMRQALLIAASQYLRPMLSHVISCSECQQNRMLQPLVKAGVNTHPEWMESKVMQWMKSQRERWVLAENRTQ